MADVFISYSQRSKEPTVELAAALTERGYDPWYDVNLLPGEAFGPLIDYQITIAKAVITIWSPPALSSPWVTAESEKAHNLKKLICVRTSEVDPQHLPTPHNITHTPLYTAFDDIFAALLKLGARPSGTSDADLPDADVLARHAARDWKNLVSLSAAPEEVRDWKNLVSLSAAPEEVEAFLEAYRNAADVSHAGAAQAGGDDQGRYRRCAREKKQSRRRRARGRCAAATGPGHAHGR